MHSGEMIIGDIPVNIQRKNSLKNMYIRVNPPEGSVVVSAPIDLTDDEIRLFVLRKIPEVKKVRDRMLAQERQTKREYVSGESHYLWGKPYRLQVIYEGNSRKILKTPTKIIMTVPEGTPVETRETIFTEWYRQELKRILDSVVTRCEKRTGLQANEYRIRNMRTRWGTCYVEDRRIWINLQLVKKPIECLEYVVTHELVHLVEKNHTHRFQSLVAEYYPAWRDAKKLLTEMPLDYMEKGIVDIDESQEDTE